MEDLDRFMTEVVELTKKAQSSYHHTLSTIQEDNGCLKKISEEFSSSSEAFKKEIMEDIEKMQQVLRLAAQQGDPAKAWSLLDSFKACFNNQNFSFTEYMTKTKQRQFKETREVLLNLIYSLKF